MTYNETIEYLYEKLPVFHKVGKSAIKPKLTNIILLCEALGNPHKKLKTIHVGGTNGKGSSSHFIASILMESGLKVGLYTSPHLKDFRERFRINGEEAPEKYIVDFVEKYKDLIHAINPSFFELTVALAFKYFEESEIDIAVIEVGLGGRYDSTNIINPIISLITNIGLDHTDILGDTIGKIAFEKAGIIKENTPIVISESHRESLPIFVNEASLKNAPIYFSENSYDLIEFKENISTLEVKVFEKNTQSVLNLTSGLAGIYQIKNILGVITLINLLAENHFKITLENIENGLENVIKNTNLKGRWQKIGENPLIICDTGHNEHALKLTFKKINELNFPNKHIILGFVKDKIIDEEIALLPKDYNYYLTSFGSQRAMKEAELNRFSEKHQLNAKIFNNVNEAISSAITNSTEKDFIFVGGSTYLIAEINSL